MILIRRCWMASRVAAGPGYWFSIVSKLVFMEMRRSVLWEWEPVTHKRIWTDEPCKDVWQRQEYLLAHFKLEIDSIKYLYWWGQICHCRQYAIVLMGNVAKFEVEYIFIQPASASYYDSVSTCVVMLIFHVWDKIQTTFRCHSVPLSWPWTNQSPHVISLGRQILEDN